MSYQTKVRANYLNRTAKLSFFRHRRRMGDMTRLSEETGYSISHLSNVFHRRRRVNDTIANAMYNLTRRRMRNSEYA
jgi:ABC-type molybdenum transport system ATPase subunit/photorepair protein PhrA